MAVGRLGLPARLWHLRALHLLVAALVLLPVASPLVAAETAASSAAAPDSYNATYGDWQLSCLRNAASAAPTVTCRVATVVFAEGEQQPFAQIAFSQSTDGLTHLTLLVPLNVLARTPPSMATDDADPGVAVPWLTCQPQGCLADLLLAEADLERLRAHASQGRFAFVDGAGNAVTVRFSFHGLAPALDALALKATNR